MTDPQFDNFARAVADLKAAVWATVEPPLTRLAEWLRRILGGGSSAP